MGSSVIPSLSRLERCARRCPERQCFLGDLFERHRDRLKRLIDDRLDGRLRSRFDASDVIQEAFVRVTTQGTAPRELPLWLPYSWLRKLVLWTLAELQRKHLGAELRDVRRELELVHVFSFGISSWDLAQRLLDSFTSPTQSAVRAERVQQLRQALGQLESIDREILVLRHVEQLTRSETAELLGISTAKAAKRYFRALARCRRLLDPQGCDDV